MAKFTLISGRDIMEILKIESGPRVGEIKSKIETAYLDGKISTRDEAIKMIEDNKQNTNLQINIQKLQK